jgi:hypothetical protein
VIIGPRAELHCTNCATSRGHIGPKTRAFLIKILALFGSLGRPTEIVMRRPISFIESTDLIFQPPDEPGELTRGSLVRRWRGSRDP